MKAIDTHVHPGTKEDVIDCGGKYIEHAFRYFGQKIEVLTEEALAERYQSLDIMGVLLGWDAETNTGLKALQRIHRPPGKEIPRDFHRFCRSGPLEGKSSHPGGGNRHQRPGPPGGQVSAGRPGLLPQRQTLLPPWEKIAELKVPVLFHMGNTGYGAGVPGGDGIRLKYCRPIP